MFRNLLWLTTLVIALTAAISVLADDPRRAPVDAASRLNRIVGEVVSEAGNGGWSGNGWFLGKDGCYVVTNFHVAFGTGNSRRVNASGVTFDDVDIIKTPGVGHRTRFNYDLVPGEARFGRTAIATVVAFGNFEKGTIAGVREDLALLRLSTCAGAEFAGLEVDQTATNQINLPGPLSTVSAFRSPHTLTGAVQIGQQSGCRPTIETPGAGLLGHSCEAYPGMSGSMLLQAFPGNELRVVGVTVRSFRFSDGTRIGIAISAKSLNRFINEAMQELKEK